MAFILMSILDFQFFIVIIASFWILHQRYKLTKQDKAGQKWLLMHKDEESYQQWQWRQIDQQALTWICQPYHKYVFCSREKWVSFFSSCLFFIVVLVGDIVNLFISDELLWFLWRPIWIFNSFFFCLDFYLLNSFM